MPFIERIIPKEWISPLAMQNSVENQLHNNSNRQTTTTTQDSNTSNSTATTTTSSSSSSSIFKSLEKLISKN